MNKTLATLSTAFVVAAAMSQTMAHDPKAKSAPMKHDAMGQMDMHGMPMTGDPDQDFATMMRAHHQKALPMARDEIAHGKDTTMRRMAQTILDAQTKEIGQFDAWLAQHPMSKNHALSNMPGMPKERSMPEWKSFAALDKDKDGYLTHRELPTTEMLDQHFSAADTNHDGKLSKSEVDQHRASMMKDMRH